MQVDTKSTGKPDAPCKVSVTTPNGQSAVLPTKATPEGYETLFAPLEPGPHIVNVDFAGKPPVPDSPFSVDVKPAPEVGAVSVTGLESRKFKHHGTNLHILYILYTIWQSPLYSNE